MTPFTIVTGTAAALPAANIDTDVIMPKQFLKGIDRNGLAEGTFHDLRFAPDGSERPDFILNKDDWRHARFLVVGPNFGCGSSREHAVWGLGQLGIRAIIGASFAGIFFDNCARNGLLAITLGEPAIARLLALAADPATNGMTIDLPAQRVMAPDGVAIPFEIEPGRKDALMRGLDEIGTTLQFQDVIRRFEQTYFAETPWLI